MVSSTGPPNGAKSVEPEPDAANESFEHTKEEDRDYAKAMKKGVDLLEKIKSGSRIESDFRDHTAFEKQGWEYGIDDAPLLEVDAKTDEERAIVIAYHSIGVFPYKTGFRMSEHNASLPLDPLADRVPSCSVMCNPKEGLLVGTWSEMARKKEDEQVKKEGEQANTEAKKVNDDSKKVLSRLSDVAFLLWSKSCADEQIAVKPFKYWVRLNTTNATTHKVFARIREENTDKKKEALVPLGMRKPSRPLEEWSFAADSDEGKALLGTPNGRSAAWIILDHDDIFAKKTVTRISCIYDPERIERSPNNLLHMIFHYGDRK